jgi:hypothetical protein
MGLLAMTVQKKYQWRHPVLSFRQTDYALSGQENQKNKCIWQFSIDHRLVSIKIYSGMLSWSNICTVVAFI